MRFIIPVNGQSIDPSVTIEVTQTQDIPFNGMFLRYKLESTALGSFIDEIEILNGTLQAEFGRDVQDKTRVKKTLNLNIYGMPIPFDTSEEYEITASGDTGYYLGDWSRTVNPSTVRSQITIRSDPLQNTPAQSIVGYMSGTYNYEGTSYVTVPGGSFNCYRYRQDISVAFSMSDVPVSMTGDAYAYYQLGTGVLILFEIKAQGTAQVTIGETGMTPEQIVSLTAGYTMELEDSNIDLQQQTTGEVPGFQIESIIIGLTACSVALTAGKRRALNPKPAEK